MKSGSLEIYRFSEDDGENWTSLNGGAYIGEDQKPVFLRLQVDGRYLCVYESEKGKLQSCIRTSDIEGVDRKGALKLMSGGREWMFTFSRTRKVDEFVDAFAVLRQRYKVESLKSGPGELTDDERLSIEAENRTPQSTLRNESAYFAFMKENGMGKLIDEIPISQLRNKLFVSFVGVEWRRVQGSKRRAATQAKHLVTTAPPITEALSLGARKSVALLVGSVPLAPVDRKTFRSDPSVLPKTALPPTLVYNRLYLFSKDSSEDSSIQVHLADIGPIRSLPPSSNRWSLIIPYGLRDLCLIFETPWEAALWQTALANGGRVESWRLLAQASSVDFNIDFVAAALRRGDAAAAGEVVLREAAALASASDPSSVTRSLGRAVAHLRRVGEWFAAAGLAGAWSWPTGATVAAAMKALRKVWEGRAGLGPPQLLALLQAVDGFCDSLRGMEVVFLLGPVMEALRRTIIARLAKSSKTVIARLLKMKEGEWAERLETHMMFLLDHFIKAPSRAFHRDLLRLVGDLFQIFLINLQRRLKELDLSAESGWNALRFSSSALNSEPALIFQKLKRKVFADSKGTFPPGQIKEALGESRLLRFVAEFERLALEASATATRRIVSTSVATEQDLKKIDPASPDSGFLSDASFRLDEAAKAAALFVRREVAEYVKAAGVNKLTTMFIKHWAKAEKKSFSRIDREMTALKRLLQSRGLDLPDQITKLDNFARFLATTDPDELNVCILNVAVYWKKVTKPQGLKELLSLRPGMTSKARDYTLKFFARCEAQTEANLKSVTLPLPPQKIIVSPQVKKFIRNLKERLAGPEVHLQLKEIDMEFDKVELPRLRTPLRNFQLSFALSYKEKEQKDPKFIDGLLILDDERVIRLIYNSSSQRKAELIDPGDIDVLERKESTRILIETNRVSVTLRLPDLSQRNALFERINKFKNLVNGIRPKLPPVELNSVLGHLVLPWERSERGFDLNALSTVTETSSEEPISLLLPIEKSNPSNKSEF